MKGKQCGNMKYWLLGMMLVISFSVAFAVPMLSEATNFRPIVILTVDKMDSLELLNSSLPSVKRLMHTGACGIMNIRSSIGFIDSASGYLTLGCGSRSTVPEISGDTFESQKELWGQPIGSYLQWSLGPTVRIQKPNLVVPEIGIIQNQAHSEDHSVDPGRLGAIFKSNGWRTCLIGNLDNITSENRPGGLILMDRHGLIDEGRIDESINLINPTFPYQYRFNTAKTIAELTVRLTPHKIIVVEYGDFNRIESYREEMFRNRFSQFKAEVWTEFDHCLARLFDLQTKQPFTLIVVAPSISRTAVSGRNLLAPIVIVDPGYPSGLLTSGTTKWPGLVANIDLLPTLIGIAKLPTNYHQLGRVMTVRPLPNYLARLKELNLRLIANNSSQRPLLDWYLGMISLGWIVGMAGIYYGYYLLRKGKTDHYKVGFLSGGIFTGIMAIPLVMMVLPLFPIQWWQIRSFLLISVLFTAFFMQIKGLSQRILTLSALTWGIIIVDQLLGWPLIRYSALGYSAMAGSRYYGLGNELMGVFLASGLILADLLRRKYSNRWISPVILGICIFVFSWPQLGAKFGGILSGSVGFAYYLIQFYKVQIKNKKLWFTLGSCLMIIIAISWWDGLRPPEVQTHIGRFARLFFRQDFAQIGDIIFRKLAMNLRLTVGSPWIRIILLVLTLGVVNRIVTKKPLARPEDILVWKSILITSLAAYLFNDAGVLAAATCLVYGFSMILLKMGREALLKEKRIKI